MFAASEPAPGSVSPYEPMMSPLASPGRYLSFCSLVPNCEIGYATSPFWTPMMSPAERLTFATSSATTTDETRSRPSPPYSLGVPIPKSPYSPIFLARSRGYSSLLSILSARGAISLLANSLAQERKSSCSGSKWIAGSPVKISEKVRATLFIVSFRVRPCRLDLAGRRGDHYYVVPPDYQRPHGGGLAISDYLLCRLEREVHVLVEALERAANNLPSLQLDQDYLADTRLERLDRHVRGHCGVGTARDRL